MLKPGFGTEAMNITQTLEWFLKFKCGITCWRHWMFRALSFNIVAACNSTVWKQSCFS